MACCNLLDPALLVGLDVTASADLEEFAFASFCNVVLLDGAVAFVDVEVGLGAEVYRFDVVFDSLAPVSSFCNFWEDSVDEVDSGIGGTN